MADRYPLIVDSTTSTIKEIQSGDNLDLTNSGIVNANLVSATSVGATSITISNSGTTVSAAIKVEHSGVGTATNLLEFNTNTANNRSYYAIGATEFGTVGEMPVVIRGDGKLGIGTTNPLTTIDVLGSIMARRLDFIDDADGIYPYPAFAALSADGAVEIYRRNPTTVGYGTTPALLSVGGPYIDFKSSGTGQDGGIRLQFNPGVGSTQGFDQVFGIFVRGSQGFYFDTNNSMHIGRASGAGIALSMAPQYRGTTKGTNALHIFNGTAPVGIMTNGISIYSTSGECFIMDSAGNATLQSPHDLVTNEWIFKSTNTVTGKTLRVDMERMMKALNDHFGWDFVTEE